jgi:hypothetical protein
MLLLTDETQDGIAWLVESYVTGADEIAQRASFGRIRQVYPRYSGSKVVTTGGLVYRLTKSGRRTRLGSFNRDVWKP